ncbi:unnamed protein product [Ophioblennius macclurei]
MDQRWIQMLVILACCREIASGAPKMVEPTEGQSVTIKCRPEMGTLIIWYRVLDKTGMEFLASCSNSGVSKVRSSTFEQLFSQGTDAITLTSFNKERDAGLYSCSSLKGNELKFGESTRLIGKKEPIKQTTKAPPATTKLPATTTPCVCNEKKGSSDDSLDCAPLILGPLAGGCGLLLLLLIVTILYCNKIRTRRCPHHHKRKMRVAPEKQLMTGRNA